MQAIGASESRCAGKYAYTEPRHELHHRAPPKLLAMAVFCLNVELESLMLAAPVTRIAPPKLHQSRDSSDDTRILQKSCQFCEGDQRKYGLSQPQLEDDS